MKRVIFVFFLLVSGSLAEEQITLTFKSIGIVYKNKTVELMYARDDMSSFTLKLEGRNHTVKYAGIHKNNRASLLKLAKKDKALYKLSQKYSSSDTNLKVSTLKVTSYNEVIKKDIEINLALILVGKGDLFIQTDSVLSTTTMVTYNRRSNLIRALKKAIKWAEISHKNKLKATKALPDINAYIQMVFHSNKDTNIQLVSVHLKDNGNKFKKGTYFLTIDETKQFLTDVESIPKKLKELREDIDKSKLLD